MSTISLLGRFSLVTVLLFCGPVRAVEPIARVDAPTAIHAGSGIILDASASTFEPGVPVEWELLDGPKTTINTFDKGVNQSVVAYLRNPEPGQYRVRLTCYGLVNKTINGKTYELLKAAIADSVINVEPSPKPVPTPTPTPTPAPVPVPTPVPSDPIEAMAQTYGRAVLESYAQTLEESANLLEPKSPEEAASPASAAVMSFDQRWRERRVALYEPIRRAYDQISPEAFEPNPEQRKALKAAWLRTAKGVRSAISR